MSTKDNTYTNIEKRLYFLSDDVDNSSIGQLTWSILYQIAEDNEKDKKEKDYKREPIKLYINSYGGAVYDMWGLIDVIQNSKTPVYTYCTGYAMSAAFKIFLAGHKRYCYKHSTFMYHQMHYYSSGKYQDHVEDRTEKDLMNKEIEEYVILDDNRFDFRDCEKNWERLLLTNGIENAKIASDTPAIETILFYDYIQSCA